MNNISPVKQKEMRAQHLKDQLMSSFSKHTEALFRIAENGPNCGDDDNALCRMMANSILADLFMSRHYARVEEF